MLTRRLLGKAAVMMAGTGGLPPRPLNAPAAGQVVSGVQPGVSQAIVLANKVIVFGTGGGVFVYSGTPGAGNPPIAWMSSSTTDPYGNTLPSTTGVAGAGTFEAGDTIITSSGLFVYSGTPSASNLIYAVTGVAGAADPFGTVVKSPGATVFNDDATFAVSSTGTFEPGGMYGTPGSATVTIASGAQTNTDTEAGLLLYSQSVAGGDAPVVATNGLLNISPQVAVPSYSNLGSTLFADLNGNLRYIQANDGTIFDTGRLTAVASATPGSPQVISSTSGVTVSGCTAAVLAGSYKLRAVVQYIPAQAAGTASFGLTGPAASPKWVSGFFGSGGAANFDATAQTGALASLTSPTMTTNTWTLIMEGFATFTGAGTLDLQAATSAGADTFSIVNGWLTIEPVA